MNRMLHVMMVPVATTFSWMLMGISSCQPQETETCDGIDNDGDGFIDEDFDADLDGYFSLDCGGGDCDDSAAAIHPGASEATDSQDNDCDGRVDEAQQAYTLNFVNAYSGEPQSGVLVWLGDDGRQAYTYSDTSGQATFELESPVQTYSYAYTHLRTSSTSSLVREYRRVVTKRNEPLNDGQEILVWDVSAVGRETVQGTLYNIDTQLPQSNILVQDDFIGTYITNLDNNSSIPYSLSAYAKEHHLLLASQTEYVVDENGEQQEVGLPARFGIVENPTYPQDIVLEHSFSLPMTYTASNLDTSMTYATPDLNLLFENGSYAYFDDSARALNGATSAETRLPPLVGSLAQARAEVDIAAWNDAGFRQGSVLSWDGQSHSLHFELKPLHSTSQSSVLTIETLPGTTVDFKGNGGSDRELVSFYQIHQDANLSNYRYYHTWSVSNLNTQEALTFPLFPKLSYDWATDPSIQLMLQYDFSRTIAYHGYQDGVPYAYTVAPIETPAQSTKEASGKWTHARRLLMQDNLF